MKKSTVFSDGGNQVLGNVLYAHFEQFQAVQCVKRSLFRDLLKGSQDPSVGLFPILSVKVPFLQLEKHSCYLFRLELNKFGEEEF